MDGWQEEATRGNGLVSSPLHDIELPEGGAPCLA